MQAEIVFHHLLFIQRTFLERLYDLALEHNRDLITDIHDWSGLLMTILVMVHVYQFRGFIRRMVRTVIT